MPSTYTVNLGIEKPATGEQSGTWGDTTNLNFDMLDQAINGAVSITLASAGTSGSPNTLAISDGAVSDGRNKWIEFTDGADLGATAYVQLTPNDAEKIVFIRNSLSGSRSVILFQGTYDAARDLEVPAGVDMVVKFSGGGATATVTDVFTKLRTTEITTPTLTTDDLTAGTADINDGTVEAVIGGTTPKAGTFTTLTANTNLTINSTTTVDGVIDDDTMATASATKLATSESIKAYVDSSVGAQDTLSEILANGNTSGSNNLIINSGQALTTNTINETTAGSGVTIDSVLLKDDVVNATDIETSNISANDGTAAATIANSTGLFTVTSFASSSVNIDGGAIDGTNIGASTRATGGFTTLLTSDTVNFDGVQGVHLRRNATPASTGTGANLLNWQMVTDGSTYTTGARIQGIADGAWSATSAPMYLSFSTVPASSVTLSERFRIAGDGGVQYFADTGTEFVINQGSSDSDFRVESDTNTHALFVDAGNNLTYVGASSTTTAPSSGGFGVKAGGEKAIVIESTSGDTLLLFRDSGTTTPPYIGSFGNDLAISGYGGGVPNVGIGLTAPQSAFHISQNGGPQATGDMTTGLIVSNGTAGTAIQMGTNDAGGYGYIKSAYVNSSQTARALLLYAGTDKAVSVETNGVVFNDDSHDRDFRVESDARTHMLFVDGGNNTVHINGTNSSGGDFNIHRDTASTPIMLTLHNDDESASSGAAMAFALTRDGGYIFSNLMQIKGFKENDWTGVPSTINGTMTFTVPTQETEREALRLSSTAAIFNETSVDRDFRVESNGNTHAIFVDASADRVAILDTTPVSAVDIVTGNGSPGDSGSFLSIKSGTGNLVEKLNLGVNSTSGYAFIAAVRPGISTRELRIQPSGGGTTFNDDGNDQDWRVESDTNTHALFVDGGNNRVGISSTSPDELLTVNGNIQFAEKLNIGTSGNSETTATVAGALATFSSGSQYSVAYAPDTQIKASTINNSAFRSVDGTGDPEAYAGDLVLWSGEARTTQSFNAWSGSRAGNVIIRAGTAYNANGYNNNRHSFTPGHIAFETGTYADRTDDSYTERMRIGSNGAIYGPSANNGGFITAEITQSHLGSDSSGTADITYTLTLKNTTGVYDNWQVMMYLTTSGNSNPAKASVYEIRGAQRNSVATVNRTTLVSGESRTITSSVSGLTVTFTIASEGASTATQGAKFCFVGGTYGCASVAVGDSA